MLLGYYNVYNVVTYVIVRCYCYAAQDQTKNIINWILSMSQIIRRFVNFT